MGRGDQIKRLIQSTARDISRAEVIRQFGQGWRGGKLDATYLSGHIPFINEPLQRGRVTFTTTDIPVNTDSATKAVTFPNAYPATTVGSGAAFIGTTSVPVASVAGLAVGQEVRITGPGVGPEIQRITAVNVVTRTLTVAAPLAYGYIPGSTVVVVPAVVPGSYDAGWIAQVDGVASISNTGFTMRLSRRVSLTNSESGSYSVHFAIGDTSHDQVINFPVAYQTTPVIVPKSDDPAFDVTIVPGSLTNATVTLRVTHINTSASGQIGYAPTGITATDNNGVITTNNLSSVDTLATTDTGSTGSTGNESAAATGNSSISTTGGESQAHTHNVPSAPPVQTGGESVGHDHGVTHTHPFSHTHPVGNHTHPHDHTHDVAAHNHSLTEPVTSGNTGHKHAFTGDSTAVTSASDHTILWIAFGTRTAPAVTEDASWVASCP